MAGELELDDVRIPLRSFDVALTLRVSSTVALVGPSGAGKSTVLNAAAGLVRPQHGRIVCGGETWVDASGGRFARPEERRVGLVYQDYALFPHLTVRQNIEYSRQRRADEFLERFELTALAEARPGQLSGGERQRVALARALARDPRALLLDEPLSALDAHTKVAVRGELQELLAGIGIPVLLVTHDFEDAAALADEVGVLVEGSIRQLASPAQLVAEPQDPFVASFTGANVVYGHANGDTRVRLHDGTEISVAEPVHGEVAVAVYPWEITLSREAPPRSSALNTVAGPIRTITELGNRVRVAVGPLSAEITAESLQRLGLAVGQPAYASFKATGARVVATAR
jgi:ABC-type sulfate/molybdate transport systems ATPase subunit